MNKTELVEAIASSTELTKTDVDKVVTALVDVVTDALAKGDKVSLKGFGNFEVRTRSERTGRNPEWRREGVLPGRQGNHEQSGVRQPVRPAGAAGKRNRHCTHK